LHGGAIETSSSDDQNSDRAGKPFASLSPTEAGRQTVLDAILADRLWAIIGARGGSRAALLAGTGASARGKGFR
jgi:hypothetical protein